MSTFQEFHGISLAPNSFIENFFVEQLASDPVPVGPGRIWFNTTDKIYKQSTLDGTGGVIVRSFATKEALDAAVSALDTRVTAIEGSYIKKDGSVAFTGAVNAGGNKVVNLAAPTADTDASTKKYVDDKVAALGSVFEYVSTIDGGAAAGSAFDLSTLAKQATGDYYKVKTAGYFKVGAGAAFFANVGDGLVFNLDGGVDKIDSTDSTVQGTASEIAVTGSADTGFTVALDSAFKGRVGTLESEVAAINTSAGLNSDGTLTAFTGTTYLDAAASLKAAAVALDTAVASEAIRAQVVEGNIASLTTDAKGSLVAAINEVDAHADAAASAASTAQSAANAAQTEVDAVEAAVGLATDGTLAAYTGTSYLGSATTIKAATVALDSAVKAADDRAKGVEGNIASLTTDAKGSLVAAINEVDAHADAAAAAVATEATRAQGVEGSLASLATTNKTNLVAAINEVKSLAGDGVSVFKAAINAARYTVTSSAAQLSHTINHALGSTLVDVCVWIDRGDGTWRNDMAGVSIVDANNVQVDLSVARKVRVTVEKMEQFA